jgi:hypothetical protein
VTGRVRENARRAAEIVLEDESGQSRPVSPNALRLVFSNFRQWLQVVVLNACYSSRIVYRIVPSCSCCRCVDLYCDRDSDTTNNAIELPLFRRSVALEPTVTEVADQPCSPAFPLMRMARCLEPGHDTTRADVCRGMPFCPCCFRVDLHPSPGLVLLLCWPQQPGQPSHLHPGPALSHRHARPPAAVNASHFSPDNDSGPKTGCRRLPAGLPAIALPPRPGRE